MNASELPIVDLGGPWRIAADDGELRRTFVSPDFDDSGWATMSLPGIWRSHHDFSDDDGPLLFRRTFAAPSPIAGQRWWLELDGVYYSADVWFDGRYLGAATGSFTRHRFDVTSMLAPTSERHVIALDVTAPTAGPSETTNTLTGILTDPDVMGATWNAGGIWRGLRLAATGPARLDTVRAVCLSATPDLATLHITATIDSLRMEQATVTTTVTDRETGTTVARVEGHHYLASGSNELRWDLEVVDPDLWWPASLGDQPLYDLTVSVSIGQAVSDQTTRRIGLRSVRTDRFITTINGVRRFLKGATLWPLDQDPTVAATKAAADVERAKNLGLDLLRVHAHIAPAELYAAADELGVLLWQDLPLRGPTTRTIEDQARKQARAMVDRLAHHPSVILWCAHDDPSGTVTNPSKNPLAQGLQFARRHLPGWTTMSLDRALARTIRHLDPSREALANSGLPPGAASPSDNDSVTWFGWRQGTGRDLAAFFRQHPRRVQWLSTFGAQSFPLSSEFVDPSRWPDLHWGELAGAFGLDVEALNRYVPAHEYDAFASYRNATQSYQATLLRRQIEEIRRHKYAPSGGFTFWTLLDTRPGVSFALYDNERVPKAAASAVAEACAPTLVVSDRLPPELAPADAVALDIDVVNDRLYGWKRATVNATVSWTGGQHTFTFAKKIEPDSVTRMGILTWVAPTAVGPVRLRLSLTDTDGGLLAMNSYASRIAGRT